MIREGRNGYLVPPGDVERLASAMNTAMERKTAFSDPEIETWERYAKRLLGLSEGLLH